MAFSLLNPKRSFSGATSGFTLVETIVVLVILGIMAVVTLSRIPSIDEHTRTIEINTLRSHLRYAQARAMATDEIWGIGFDDSATYRLLKAGAGSTLALPGSDITDASLNPDNNPLTVNLMGLKLEAFVDETEIQQINFNRMGAPANAAGVGWDDDVSVRQEGGVELFKVNAVTGFIE